MFVTWFEWLLSKRQKIINGSEDVAQREHLYDVSPNEN
jgi:hypothetical protein